MERKSDQNTGTQDVIWMFPIGVPSVGCPLGAHQLRPPALLAETGPRRHTVHTALLAGCDAGGLPELLELPVVTHRGSGCQRLPAERENLLRTIVR